MDSSSPDLSGVPSLTQRARCNLFCTANPLIQGGDDAGQHRRGRLPVDPPHRAAAGAVAAAARVAHQLIDDPRGDGGILQPGGEGVPQVMGATQVQVVKAGPGRIDRGLVGRRLTSRGRAVALQQLAVGHALAGDEVACQRALDAAVQLAERSQQDHDEGPGRYCTPAYVEIQRAATWIELGRPERAIDLFEDSLVTLPSVHRRDRGVYLARLASAYALSGSPDISVRKGWEALTVAQATGSRRITTELGQLGSRLTRWESMPEVGQLLKELQVA